MGERDCPTNMSKKTRSEPKKSYRIRNWSAYDAALVNRGSLTVWVSEDAIANWKAKKEPGKRGRQREYSDFAIETVLTLREVYHLTNRGAEGFVRSLFEIMQIDLPVPDHTTLSVRGQSLDCSIAKKENHFFIHRCRQYGSKDLWGRRVENPQTRDIQEKNMA